MRFVLSLALLLLPSLSHGAPMLSEIAWMGTDADANNEWIELYNFGDAPVDLSGWTLTDGVNLTISLSGTMGPHGVELLERTDDESVPGVSAFMVYTGALGNGGVTLTLRDQSGTIVDQVVGGENWGAIGGSNTLPKKTAQRTRTNTWVTGTPTPGAENVQVDEVVEDEEEENDEENDDESGEVQGTTTTRKSSGSANKRTSIVQATAELTVTLTAPDVVYVNQPVSFVTTASGPGRDIMNSLVYSWNFGDSYTGVGKQTKHIYTYPGEYLVVVNAKYLRHDVTIQKIIRVLPVGVAISRTKNGDIILTNTASHDVDISGYTLTGTESIVLPPNTYLMKGGSITIAESRVSPTGLSMIALYDTDRTMIASESSALPSPILKTFAQAVSPALVSMRQSAPVAVKSASAPKPPSNSTSVTSEEVKSAGAVAGTSTILNGLTIPVYASEETPVLSVSEKSRTLPYIALVLVIIMSIVLLYRRPHSHGDV